MNPTLQNRQHYKPSLPVPYLFSCPRLSLDPTASLTPTCRHLTSITEFSHTQSKCLSILAMIFMVTSGSQALHNEQSFS